RCRQSAGPSLSSSSSESSFRRVEAMPTRSLSQGHVRDGPIDRPMIWTRLPNGESVHLAESPRFDLIDEPAHMLLVRDEGASLDPGNRLTDVLLEIVERLRRPLRFDPRLVLHLATELVVTEGQHAAVGVVGQHDLFGPQQALRNRQRANL